MESDYKESFSCNIEFEVYPIGIREPLEVFRVPLLAQWVKNLPANQKSQETRAQFLGQEDPLEKGMTTLSSILAWKIPWTEHGVAKSLSMS